MFIRDIHSFLIFCLNDCSFTLNLLFKTITMGPMSFITITLHNRNLSHKLWFDIKPFGHRIWLDTGLRGKLQTTVECILQSGPRVLGGSRAAFKLVSRRTFAARALFGCARAACCLLAYTQPSPPSSCLASRPADRPTRSQPGLLNRLLQIS